jgi:pimeloyl-ACP methyl ester carboxylesterase
MNQGNRVLFRLASSAPFLVPGPIKVMSLLVKRSPRRAATMMLRSLPPPDRAVLDRVGIDDLVRDSREAFRMGDRGAVHETKLVVRPWGFDLAQIKVPVHLWQGLDDANVPPAMGRYMAGVIPDCHVTFIPDAGHFWALGHPAQVLEALAPAGR